MAVFEDAAPAHSADEPTRSIAAPPAPGDSIDPSWIMRLLRFGFALAIVAQVGYVADNYLYLSPALARLAAPYALLGLAAAILAAALSLRPTFSRYWKAVTLGLCLCMMAAWTVITVLVGQQTTLFVAIIVVLMATCTLAPWGSGWQAVLTAGSIAACAFNTMLVRPANPYIGYLWLDVLTASVLAMASSQLWTRWRAALAETHRQLRSEVSERERTIAEREEAQRRLRESEAELRKIFEACPDAICINSMIDGRYIDLNKEFFSTGYTREEALKGPLGVWADGEQCGRFVQDLTAHGIVRNMEANLRLKDGTVRPCLISGAMVEIDGEPCAVSFTSDISRLKRT
jgi:PAS domain S-box-containing protein